MRVCGVGGADLGLVLCDAWLLIKLWALQIFGKFFTSGVGVDYNRLNNIVSSSSPLFFSGFDLGLRVSFRPLVSVFWVRFLFFGFR